MGGQSKKGASIIHEYSALHDWAFLSIFQKNGKVNNAPRVRTNICELGAHLIYRAGFIGRNGGHPESA